jgi:flagellar M-ring protein FliF
MTEFAQRMNYQRALQGELTRTISQLDNVEMAMVHIAIPAPNVFEPEKNHPTASVVVKLSPGGELSPAQVGGVVHLVSSAIEGMKPNYVTIVDTRGNMLSEASDDTGGLNAQLNASQTQFKKSLEQGVQRDIQSMLERILGPNKAIVRVNAKMNFDQRETSSELYQPAAAAKGVLADEQTMQETYGGAGGAGGAAGVSNTLRRRPLAAGSQPPGYQRVENTNKYQVSKTTEHVIKAPGEVQQLMVAVMVDQKAGGARVNAIRNTVEAAAGIDMSRGDKVIIESVPFDDTTAKNEEKEMKAAAAKQTYFSVGKDAAGVILLLAFAFFLRGMFKQINLRPPDRVLSPVAATASGGDSLDLSGGAQVIAASSALAEAKPEDVAQVVREWISRS